MEILERPNGSRYGFASLRNIGYDLFEVNLDGEVYKYGIRDKAERVRSNRWKIYTRDRSGRLIEQVMRTDVLVGCAWWNVDESLWQNSIYADTIRRCKEFFSIPPWDIRKTDYKTSRGFSYYVTRFGEVWSTEYMIKHKGGVSSNGYRYVILGSGRNARIHRLVAHHFVPKPKDLVDQGLKEDDLVVNHLDGNKLNNRWDNLEWTTHAGNLAHAYATGLRHITIDDHVLERIWQRLEEGYSDTNISKETGISADTVSLIRHGRSPRYRTDKYTWPKHSPDARVLDKDTIFNIYDEFTYTDKKNCEICRKYNVNKQLISRLRLGHRHSDLAREYINSKGLDGYWKGYRHPK
jgi:hypothetical protein